MRLRNDPYDPTTVIPLHDEGEILQRWEDYFKNLVKEGTSVPTLCIPSHSDHPEPSILAAEVKKVIRSSLKGKAAGEDNITTKLIFACGNIGVR